MKSHLLHKFERAFVEEARANTKDKVAYMKLSVLVMLDEGLTQEVVSVSLGISIGTVNKCKRKYESEGLDSYLDRHYVPYQGRLDGEQLALLEEEVQRGLYSSCAAVGQWIEEAFGVHYSESAIRSILDKLGFVYKKTSSVPGKADVAEQEAFMKELVGFLEETDLESEVVCFIDAVHPQHNTRPDYAWIKQGQDKEIRTNTGRSRININAGMNAHDPQDVTVIEAECIDADATITLFEKIRAKYDHKEDIWLIGDNAGYYTCHKVQEWLEQNPKVQLLHLPPYSPNLNLIERLWKFLRKKIINLQYYPKFEEFRRSVLDFFENLEQYKWELKTLITPNFQRFSGAT